MAALETYQGPETRSKARRVEELTELKAKCKQLEKALKEKDRRFGVLEVEFTEWKRKANTSENVEEWVASLSEFIFELQSRMKELLDDFDDDENHVPTKEKTKATYEQQLKELEDKLRYARHQELELKGVLKVLREDIKRAGWQPEKLDELLENSRRDYRRVYTEVKLQVGKTTFSRENTFFF